MNLNQQSIAAAFRGFSSVFQGAFRGVKPQYPQFCMTVPSSTAENVYPWLKSQFFIREWIGPRRLQNLGTADWSVKNRDFEGTVAVPRNAVKDDQLGVYKPMFEQIGHETAVFPDRLAYALLKAGVVQKCWDGQYFFDTDHPVGPQGREVSQSNFLGGGTGPLWFLVVSSMPLKPLIYQEREAFNLVRKDTPSDDNVFFDKELIYGTDGRCNVGFGLWQLAVASNQPLNADNYEAARNLFGAMTKDNGEPLGVMGDLLIFPATLEGAARKVVGVKTLAGGGDNPWYDTATLLRSAWLN
ncbi:MAG: Mu-like prophage major head subunit gpT family protein [Rhodocyclaceae bacterium]|nr:Mu-like prophage major head subunit gpT family protein [Rhodocyclaceae bacterium]